MAGNKIDKSPERERFDLWLFWIWVLLGFVLSVLIFVKRWFTAVVFRNGDWAREVNFGGAFLLFGFLAFLWMKSINKIVPDPYLVCLSIRYRHMPTQILYMMVSDWT